MQQKPSNMMGFVMFVHRLG